MGCLSFPETFIWLILGTTHLFFFLLLLFMGGSELNSLFYGSKTATYILWALIRGRPFPQVSDAQSSGTKSSATSLGGLEVAMATDPQHPAAWPRPRLWYILTRLSVWMGIDYVVEELNSFMVAFTHGWLFSFSLSTGWRLFTISETDFPFWASLIKMFSGCDFAFTILASHRLIPVCRTRPLCLPRDRQIFIDLEKVIKSHLWLEHS